MAYEIELDTSEANRALATLLAAGRKMVPEIQAALASSAREVAKDTRALLRQSSDSPSPPGQPPAKVTGALARSVRARQTRRRRGGLVQLGASVAVTEFYARTLETGRRAGQVSRKAGLVRRRRLATQVFAMAARPHVTRALELKADVIADRIRLAITAALQRIGA